MKTFKLGPLQKKWIARLKAHPERQLTNQLGELESNGKYKACCLGELGLIAGTCEWIKSKTLIEKTSGSALLLTDSYGKVGLRNKMGVIKYPKSDLSLAILNDDGHHTWPEIAYLIEAAPELFFTKSV